MSSSATYQVWGQLKLHEICLKKEKKKERREENKENYQTCKLLVEKWIEIWQLKKKMVQLWETKFYFHWVQSACLFIFFYFFQGWTLNPGPQKDRLNYSATCLVASLAKISIFSQLAILGEGDTWKIWRLIHDQMVILYK